MFTEIRQLAVEFMPAGLRGKEGLCPEIALDESAADLRPFLTGLRRTALYRRRRLWRLITTNHPEQQSRAQSRTHFHR
jgi:hypothetical protein